MRRGAREQRETDTKRAPTQGEEELGVRVQLIADWWWCGGVQEQREEEEPTTTTSSSSSTSKSTSVFITDERTVRHTTTSSRLAVSAIGREREREREREERGERGLLEGGGGLWIEGDR